MPISTSGPGTAGWWLKRLAEGLGKRRAHYDRMERYYNGSQAVPVSATKSIREAYARLMAMARMDWAELVVEAVRERMQPLGFRTGADDDELGDDMAWQLWQANALDADSSIVHRTSLALGQAYVIVGGPDAEIGGYPLITPEDPREVYVEHDPSHRRKALAAIKLYYDEIQARWIAYLYLPGVVATAAGPAHMPGDDRNSSPSSFDWAGWNWIGPPQEFPAAARNVIPVVAFPNQVFNGRPMAEFEKHLGVLDRISYQILNRLEIATLQAFKQRAVKGVPDKDPETGDTINYDDVFAADPGALWVLPLTAEIWESNAVDLSPIRMAVRDDVQDLAAVTRTPLFYLTPEGANGSAEGAALAREGLVFKTSDRLTQAGESWEQVMSLAFLFAGDTQRSQRPDMEIIWADPERFGMAERYDAAVKAQSAGVPWRTVMRKVLQFTPQEIERMASERVADAMQLAAFAPGNPAGVGPQPMSMADIKAAADAMGVLIRSGASPESAAVQVGLTDLTFTGAVPTTLRLPQSEAVDLEQVGGGAPPANAPKP